MRIKFPRGFTLVEILIVVVIVGILAAIVIPQFTNASEAAKRSAAQSQLQAARSQIQLYLNHNSAYPDLLAGEPWSAMLDPTVTGGPYFDNPPKNPYTGSSAIAATPSAAVGWVWDTSTNGLRLAIEQARFDESAGMSDRDFATYP